MWRRARTSRRPSSPVLGSCAFLCALAAVARLHAQAPQLIELTLPDTRAQDADTATDPDAWLLDYDVLFSGGWVQYGHGNPESSQLELERLSPVLRGETADGRARFRLELDAGVSRTYDHLFEAWYGHDLGDDGAHRLQIGFLPLPFASEGASRTESLPFHGYGFTSFHVSRHDYGLLVEGYPSDTTWWSAGGTLSRGGGFGRSGDELDHSPQLSLRSVLTSKQDETHAFEGPFVGLSLAYNPSYKEELKVENPLYQTVFKTAETKGSDARWLMLEGGWREGPFRAGAETLRGNITDVDLPTGGEDDMDQITAWTAWMAWNFHGDAPPWERGAWSPYEIEPGASFDERPLELAVRYSNSDIDRKFFDSGLTNYTQSTQEVRTFSGALTSYMDEQSRLLLQWTKTIADDEIKAFGKRNRDSSWVLRWDRWF